MATVITTTPATQAPRALAEHLDTLAADLAHDREIAAVLVSAREALRALAWNRYAASVTARTRRLDLKGRHADRGVERLHLRRMARARAADPAILARAFARHRARHGVDDDALAAHLGLRRPASLVALAVEWVPGKDSEWADLAGRYGLDPARLAAILREAGDA